MSIYQDMLWLGFISIHQYNIRTIRYAINRYIVASLIHTSAWCIHIQKRKALKTNIKKCYAQYLYAYTYAPAPTVVLLRMYLIHFGLT